MEEAEKPGGRRTWTSDRRLGLAEVCLALGGAKGVVLKYRRTPGNDTDKSHRQTSISQDFILITYPKLITINNHTQSH